MDKTNVFIFNSCYNNPRKEVFSMEYNVIKNAAKIVSSCPYVVNDPTKYKNKWHDLFGNHNPIM